MKSKPSKPLIKPKPLSQRQQSAIMRDRAANMRKPAPYGRYEDGSPMPKPKTKIVVKKAKKK